MTWKTRRTTRMIRGEPRPVRLKRLPDGKIKQTILDKRKKSRKAKAERRMRYRIKASVYEKELLRVQLEQAGYDPDKIPIDELYDPNLTYTQNIRQNFKEWIKTTDVRSELYRARRLDLIQYSHESRPRQDWLKDEARTHKVNVPISKLDKESENRWRNNPGGSDVQTVDDRLAKKERVMQEKRARRSLKKG